MACNSCAKAFSLIRNEHGCPGCGFAFCSKCLSHKIFLPKLNAEAKVCMKCTMSPRDQNKKTPADPPAAYLKRMESLVNPARPPITVYEQDKFQKLKRGLSVEDQKIVDRLQQLKADRDPAPPPENVEQQIMERLKRLRDVTEEAASTTDGDVQARLSKLKGVPATASCAAAPIPMDLRTDQEKSDDLLRQYMEEANIDTSNRQAFDSRIDDIESRLHALRGTSRTGPAAACQRASSESEDEEEYVRKVVEKIKAEVALDPELVADGGPGSEELPWCEVCNEDAKMRCLGCRYLFCKQCYLEHRDDDDGCNRYEPYQKPNRT